MRGGVKKIGFPLFFWEQVEIPKQQKGTYSKRNYSFLIASALVLSHQSLSLASGI